MCVCVYIYLETHRSPIKSLSFKNTQKNMYSQTADHNSNPISTS